MIRFKLLTAMPQESQPFSIWWAKVNEQTDNYVFAGQNLERAAFDAVLFQATVIRLSKKVLIEDMRLKDLVKME